MAEIRRIDLAWEAINTLGDLSRKVLAELERLGGKAPERPAAAADGIRVVLHSYGYDSIAGIIAKATGTSPQAIGGGALESKTISLRSLIQAFKQDPNGRYQKLAYNTRFNYDRHFQQIDREVGDLPLEAVTPDKVLSWYERWSSHGKCMWMGHDVIGKVRMLLRYGAATMQDGNCIRLNGALSSMRIKTGTSNARWITAKQADAIRIAAHKKKLPSIALAQAFMYDLKLGQKEVLGDWVPLSEPGESEIKKRNKKWLPGLLWSQIDGNFVLRRAVGDEIQEINLKRHAMVMAELNRLGDLPKSGPLIVREKKRLPYEASLFRLKWRSIATAVGIPRSVRNVHYQGRGPKAVSQTNDKKNGKLERPSDPEILERVSAVRKLLPEDIRDDVAQQMVLDVVAGNISLDQLSEMKTEYVRRHHKSYDNRFAIRSLDEPIPGTDKLKLGDTIPSDRDMWSSP